MASALVTVPKPFFAPRTQAHSPLSQPLLLVRQQNCLVGNAAGGKLRSNSLRINAVAKKWEPAKVVPQADRVLIRLEELPDKSAGGVLLPKSAVKFERYLLGEVLSIGADVSHVEAGKKVLLSDINAHEVDLGTEAKHCFCKASDLLAIVE